MRPDRYSTQSIDESDIAAVVEALKSDTLTGGIFVERFEADLCAYATAKFCVVFSSATAALHAAYAVSGIGAKDEVIVPAITFAATANAALYCGATPVFAEIRFSTGLIDETKIERLITLNTKAIVPVHYAGSLCNMDEINRIARKHNLIVIEDAAHALGSFNVAGKSAGTFGKMGVFSFHPVKPITTGEGGAVVTNDEALAKKLRLFRSHGIERGKLWNQEMVTLGYNYRLSDIACALGVSQLKKLDATIAARERIAAVYDNAFKNHPQIFPLRLPADIKSSRHLYPVLLDRSLWCAKEEIFSALQTEGIGVQVHYKPVYQHPYYRERFPNQNDLDESEAFYRAELSLPCHPLLSEAEAMEIARKLDAILTRPGCRA